MSIGLSLMTLTFPTPDPSKVNSAASSIIEAELIAVPSWVSKVTSIYLLVLSEDALTTAPLRGLDILDRDPVTSVIASVSVSFPLPSISENDPSIVSTVMIASSGRL